MVELANWLLDVQAEGYTIVEVRVSSPWSDYLVAQGMFPAGDVQPALSGEENLVVVATSTGEYLDAVLCA